MRKELFFIGMLVIASLFAGCSKEKEENVPLIGRWEFSSQKADVKTSDEDYNNNIRTSFEIKSATTPIWTFKEDNKVTIQRFLSISEYLYSVEGNELTIIHPVTNSAVAYFEYSISGNTLTLYEDVTEEVRDALKDYEIEVEKLVIIQKFVR